MERILVFLLFGLSFVYKSHSQEIPANACPQYFQYLSYNGMYIGKVTLPVSGSGTTLLELRFSQRGATNGHYGRVVTFYDKDTTRENLKNGLGLVYRVDFPFANILPKITRITVNGQEICSSSAYPPPSSVIRMQHNLTISETIIQETKPFNTEFVTNGNNGNNYISYGDPPGDGFFPNAIGTTFPQNLDSFFSTTPFREIPQRIPQVQRTSTLPPPVYRPRTTRPPEPVVRAEPPSPPIDYRRDPKPYPVTTPTPPPPVTSSSRSIQEVCGRRTSAVTTFIHHGTTLIRGQFPWLTAMYRKISGGVEFLCSGSLVSSRAVITAAHCFRSNIKAEHIVLYLGRYDLDDYGEQGYMVRQVESLLINPEYNLNRLADADIALMHLKQPVPFTDFISPICLWSEVDDLAQIVGLKGFVAGWGADESNSPITNLPKMVNATIVDDNECRSVDGFASLITSRTICAGNRDGSGPCMGDSGSGLMIQRNRRWTLRGVVSAGQVVDGRCMLESYVVYCDLAKHRPWIESNMVY